MTKAAPLVHESDWKSRAVWTRDGYFRLETGDTGEVPVRLFVTQKLLTEAEPTLYRQIVNATKLVRGGAEHYVEAYGAAFDRSRAERHRIPVEDAWRVPWGGKGMPERGQGQLGSLGGGNHFIELQRCEETGTLFVQVHTGSRGFGHGLATNYFEMARAERAGLGGEVTDIDLGYFTPESRHFRDYLNAVAAGGNFAILNRLVIFEQIADAFQRSSKPSSSSSTRSATTSCRPRTTPSSARCGSTARARRGRSPAATLRCAGRSGRTPATPCSSPGPTATTATS